MKNENCGKTTYQTAKQATTAKNRIKKNSKRNHIPKRIYFCKRCKGFHLTSMKNKLGNEFYE